MQYFKESSASGVDQIKFHHKKLQFIIRNLFSFELKNKFTCKYVSRQKQDDAGD